MTTPSPDFAAAIADRYLVEKEVGRGGMAVVYLANDLKHGRRVAIKVMAPSIARQIGPELFLREIEIAARLNHPHILPLFDSGVAAGQLYYVMPFIDGESLRGRLQREKRLPLGEALRLTREIAGALNHAHVQGLVHRDVKPENVLLSDGIPLVADFGIAKRHRSPQQTPTAAEEEITNAQTITEQDDVTLDASQFLTALDSGGDASPGPTREVIGTPSYMAPEQASGQDDLDGRADQYALGCVFYEMLSGEPPFRGRNTQEVLELQVRGQARDIVALRPDVPEDVAHALTRALAKSPSDRFPEMTQFSEALNAAAVRAYALAFRDGEKTGVPNNLPVPLTSFIGREKEVDEIKSLLLSTRLLTLTGSGGTGKTRLSLHVAAEILERYGDGAWLVELAPLSDPSLITKAAATALGIRETVGETITQTLVSSIRNKAMLLVLDNCEHLLDSAAQLVRQLLESCSELRVLVSSREALGIPGEVSYRVPSLPVPGLNQNETPDTLAHYASARLFIQRALASKSDFVVTAQNAPAIASVCRRLDGVPLAIELAAARARVLQVEQIEERLDARFRLLTGGSRTALPRQQTLRALIDWSYDLLKEPEKAMLRRLSVFAGGWSLESAEGVCSDDAIEQWDVLDLLTSLVDKSLVGFEGAEGTSRYRLLETVRQYARDRLLEAGEAEHWRDRHLAHFLGLAEEAAPHLVGADQRRWLERLETENENLRTAMEWGDGDPMRAPSYLKLAGALQQFWIVRGHLFEGRARLARALALDAGSDRADRARALNGAGNLAYSQADYAAARALHEESLAIRRELGDDNGIATSLNNLGSVAYYQGDLATTRALFEESLAIRRKLGQRSGISSSLNNLGLLAQKQNDPDAARAYLTEGLAIRRELGDRTGIGASLQNLGVMDYMQGLYASAQANWEESLAIRRELGDRAAVASVLQNLGKLSLDRGEYDTARGIYEQRLAVSRELGDQLGVIDALEALADVALASQALDRAVILWAAASRVREEIGSPTPVDQRAVREQEMDHARSVLGEEPFAAAWARGLAMTTNEVDDFVGAPHT